MGTMPYAHPARLRAGPGEGLYDPAFEHDACGVAFVATLTGVPSHAIVEQGLEALRNLDHRGATGVGPQDRRRRGHPDAGPGRASCAPRSDFDAAPAGRVRGRQRLPAHRRRRAAAAAKATIERIAAEEGLTVLGWRVVTTDDASLSRPDPRQHARLRAAVRRRRRAGR